MGRVYPLIKGKTISVDSTTLEPNAAMKSIVRRDTQEGYTEYLKRLAEAAELETRNAAGLLRMDRKRPKTMSNQDWHRRIDHQDARHAINPGKPETTVRSVQDLPHRGLAHVHNRTSLQPILLVPA